MGGGTCASDVLENTRPEAGTRRGRPAALRCRKLLSSPKTCFSLMTQGERGLPPRASLSLFFLAIPAFQVISPVRSSHHIYIQPGFFSSSTPPVVRGGRKVDGDLVLESFFFLIKAVHRGLVTGAPPPARCSPAILTGIE